MKKVFQFVVMVFAITACIGCGEASKGKNENTIGGNISNESEKNKADNKIIVYMEQESKMLNEVKKSFQDANPDYEIEFMIGNSQERIAVVNSVINGEEAPDLLIIDNFDNVSSTFYEKLLPMDEEIESSLLIPAVRGKTEYSIPLRVNYPILFTTKAIYSDPTFFMKSLNEIQIENISYKSLTELFYFYYPLSFVNDNKSLDANKLRAFLENMKSIGESLNVSIEDADAQKEELEQIKDFVIAGNSIMFSPGEGLEELKYYISATRKLHGAAIPIEGAEPRWEIAVYENSRHKDMCIEFIKMALSKDIQINDFSEGFPVLTEALESWGSMYTRNEEKISLGYKDDKEVFIEDPIEEEIANLISMIREEESIYKRDRAMYELIWEDAMHYFSKEISIEAATESIVKNYNTYLSEYSEWLIS